MISKIDNWLLRISGLLLLMAGVLKLISVFTKVAYLHQPNPVLTFVTNKTVLLLAANLEIGIAAIILVYPASWVARYGLLALCITFGVYRFGLWLLLVHQPCPCLGRASDWLHLTPYQVDRLAFWILGILTATGVFSVSHFERTMAGSRKNAL